MHDCIRLSFALQQIEALNACHKENKLAKFWGKVNLSLCPQVKDRHAKTSLQVSNFDDCSAMSKNGSLTDV